MLSQEQTEQVKKQLIQQIKNSFPEDKKELAKNQIEAMNSEQLETFLEKNKLIKTEEVRNLGSAQQCIFCSIVFGNMASYKIDENDRAIAVLEINPISKGHILVIPKEHISSSEKLPKEVFSLAREVSKKIKTKLKPKKVNISSSNLFGHEVINIFPIYENETPTSERRREEPEELEKLQKSLRKESRKKTPEKIKHKPKKLEDKLWLPKRIP